MFINAIFSRVLKKDPLKGDVAAKQIKNITPSKNNHSTITQLYSCFDHKEQIMWAVMKNNIF